jgi:Flp pilus assembly pilin Flp
MRFLKRFEKGQGMTEYALILAAIAVVCIVAYQAVGTEIVNILQNEIVPALQGAP